MYTVSSGRIAEIEKRVEKMRKAGNKVRFEILKQEIRKFRINTGPLGITKFFYIDVTDFILEVEVERYRVLHVIEHNFDNDGNPVNIVYGDCDDAEYLSKLYQYDANCEHCNSKRNRKTTVILLDTENGQKIQVGKSCLKDYTSNINALVAVGGIASVTKIIDDDVDEWRRGRHCVMLTLDYLAACICEQRITNKGYFQDLKINAWLERGATEDYETAKQVMEFFDNLNGNNSQFIENLKNALKTKYTKKPSGFVASALHTMQRLTGEKAAYKNSNGSENESEFIGKPGDRITIDAIYVTCITFDGFYGTTFIHKFADTNGNVLIWKTSSNPLNNIESSNKVNIVATIKEHDTYHGVKQTHLLRAKVKRL